jgi:kynurenine formamidase
VALRVKNSSAPSGVITGARADRPVVRLAPRCTSTYESVFGSTVPGFDWPVHHVLLGHGVLVAGHLRNLRPLAGRRIEAMFLALAIEGSDGGPARVAARAVTHER